MKLSRTFTFDAAHRLPNYKGKCSQLHGHRWKVKYIIEGPVLLQTGMVVDFKFLKENVELEIVNLLDHTYLNDIFSNPTAENIARFIFKYIENLLKTKEVIALLQVEVWESPESSAIVMCTDYELFEETVKEVK